MTDHTTDACYDMDEPERTMLNERSQSQMTNTVWLHLHEMWKPRKSRGTNSRFDKFPEITGLGLGVRVMGCDHSSIPGFFWGNENALNLDSGDGCINIE